MKSRRQCLQLSSNRGREQLAGGLLTASAVVDHFGDDVLRAEPPSDAPVESLTRTVTFGAPGGPGGVPESAPVAALIESHPGPEVIAHVYGGVPPAVGVTVKL